MCLHPSPCGRGAGERASGSSVPYVNATRHNSSRYACNHAIHRKAAFLQHVSQSLGSRLNIAWRTGSSLNVLAIAAAGLGVALVPEPLEQVHVPGLAYRRLDAPELTANLLMIARKEESNPAVKTWLKQGGKG